MKYLIITLLFSMQISLYAQMPQRHEFSAHVGGGLSTLRFGSLSDAQAKNGFGGQFGIGYNYFIVPKWAIGSGIDIALYNSRLDFNNNISSVSNATDRYGAGFEFTARMSDYNEKQRLINLQIPLMLYHLSKETDKKYRYYGGIGIKIGIPIEGKYNSEATLTTQGHYPADIVPIDNVPFMGFGTFASQKDRGNLAFNTSYILAVQAGMKWKLNESFSLYTGLYLDYGLNNIAPAATDKPLVAYNAQTPTDFTIGSALDSRRTSASAGISDKLSPLSAGLTVRLSYTIRSAKSKSNAKSENEARRAAEEAERARLQSENEARRAAEEAERARLQSEAEARRAAEEAERARSQSETEARRVAEEAERARSQSEAEARRAAEEAERARSQSEAEAIRTAIQQIQQPVSDYAVVVTTLDAAQRAEFDRKVELLKKYPQLNVRIYGHTCDLGTTAVNERIGKARADNVRSYLIANGIASNRILSTESKRDTEPIVPNTSEENRKQNRRVQIIVQQ